MKWLEKLSNEEKLKELNYNSDCEDKSRRCVNCMVYDCPCGVELCQYFGINKNAIQLPHYNGTCKYFSKG